MNLIRKLGLWGLLVGGTGTALHADPAGGWLSPNGTAGGNPSTSSSSNNANAPTPPTDPSAAARIEGNPADLQVRAHLMQEQTRADARHVMYLQQIAKKEKDVIKLNCVNDKLVQIKPQMNMVDAGVSDLGSASDATRMAAFGNISQSSENVRRLREEADQCIGESIAQGDSESSNSFTGPNAPDDPTKGANSHGGGLEAPGYASPFN